MKVEIELLYMTDCPSFRPTLAQLEAVLAEEELDAAIRLIPVEDEELSRDLQFRGSPSLRIGGQDIEGVAAPPVGFTCRTYRLPDGRVSSVPSRDRIRQALYATRAEMRQGD